MGGQAGELGACQKCCAACGCRARSPRDAAPSHRPARVQRPQAGLAKANATPRPRRRPSRRIRTGRRYAFRRWPGSAASGRSSRPSVRRCSRRRSTGACTARRCRRTRGGSPRSSAITPLRSGHFRSWRPGPLTGWSSRLRSRRRRRNGHRGCGAGPHRRRPAEARDRHRLRGLLGRSQPAGAATTLTTVIAQGSPFVPVRAPAGTLPITLAGGDECERWRGHATVGGRERQQRQACRRVARPDAGCSPPPNR